MRNRPHDKAAPLATHYATAAAKAVNRSPGRG